MKTPAHSARTKGPSRLSFGPELSRRGRLAGWMLSSAAIIGSAGALPAAAAPTDAPADSAPAFPATWVPRKLRFTFQGLGTAYSCDGLRDQMKSILTKLGARDDLKLRTTGCVHGSGPEQFPGVDATIYVLAPPGADTKDADTSKPTQARWETVSLNSDTVRETNSGQCQLIEQVKRTVLPLFNTRNVNYTSDCFPHAESLAGAKLSVEVLRAVKPAASDAKAR